MEYFLDEMDVIPKLCKLENLQVQTQQHKNPSMVSYFRHGSGGAQSQQEKKINGSLIASNNLSKESKCWRKETAVVHSQTSNEDQPILTARYTTSQHYNQQEHPPSTLMLIIRCKIRLLDIVLLYSRICWLGIE